MGTQLIELDARRRTSLGKVGHKEHDRYLVDERPDGTIVLTPAIVVPATLSEERIASIQKGIADSRAGRVRSLDKVVADLGIDED